MNDPDDRLARRKFIKATGASIAIASLAGCSGDGDDDGSDGTGDDGSDGTGDDGSDGTGDD
ncbi:MAG: carbohydrate ABC transporter substrate-binding protein, partial [Halovenus sp.]